MLVLDKRFDYHGQSVAWGSLGSGPPLVMVHGTPFSSQVWRKIAPLLTPHWTIYVFDLLGYGRSEMADGQDVSLGVQNELLAALWQHWEIESADVLCHDFGGATALRAHLLNGLHFRSLTIFDAVVLEPWGSPFVQHVRKHEDAFAGMPAYAHAALLEAYLQSAVARPMDPVALGIYADPWTGEIGQAAFYRQIAQMDVKYTREIAGDLERLRQMPVQVLWGEEDNWLPVAQGESLASLISETALIRVKAAGHLMQEDAPEAIVAAMMRHQIT